MTAPRRLRVEGLPPIFFSRPRGAPLAQVAVWVEVGGGEDPSDAAGLAHLCEHLVMRRTTPRSTMDRWAALDELGWMADASTGVSATRFTAVGPPGQLGAALRVLSARMQRPLLDAASVATELKVVAEELRGRRRWRRLIDEHISAALFGLRSVGGDPAQLEVAAPREVRGFHRRGYRKERLGMIVEADLPAATVRRAVAEAFGGWPRGAQGPAHFFALQPDRLFAREDPSLPQPFCVVGFGAPAPGQPGRPVMEALLTLLSARTGAESWASFEPAPGAVGVLAAAQQDALVTPIEAVVRAVRSLTRSIRAAELARVRDAILERWEVALDDRASRLEKYCAYERQGVGPEGIWGELAALMRLRPRTAQQAAAALFDRGRMRVVVLTPRRVDARQLEEIAARLDGAGRKDGGRRGGDAAPGTQLTSGVQAQRAGSMGAGDAAPPGLRALRATGASRLGHLETGAPKLWREQLADGVEVVIRATPGRRHFEVQTAFARAPAAEPPETALALELFMRLLNEGAAASFGPWLLALLHPDALGAAIVARPTELLSRVRAWRSWLQPERGAAQRSLRERFIREQRANEDDPRQVALWSFREAVFGDHPYARPTWRPETPRLPSHAQILEAGRALVATAPVSICVDGPPLGRRERASLLRVFERLGARGPLPHPGAALGTASTRERRHEAGARFSVMAVGYGCPPPGGPLHEVESVTAHALFSDSGALARELRARAGLVYGVDRIEFEGREGGYRAVLLAMAPDRLPEVEQRVRRVLERVEQARRPWAAFGRFRSLGRTVALLSIDDPGAWARLVCRRMAQGLALPGEEPRFAGDGPSFDGAVQRVARERLSTHRALVTIVTR